MTTTIRLRLFGNRRNRQQQSRQGDTLAAVPQPAGSERIAQQAFHTAYRRFAREHAAWVARGFDDRFLRGPGARILAAAGSPSTPAAPQPNGMDLARAWDRQFGVLLTSRARVEALAQLSAAAGTLLYWYVSERDRLAPK